MPPPMMIGRRCRERRRRVSFGEHALDDAAGRFGNAWVNPHLVAVLLRRGADVGERDALYVQA